MRTPLRQSDDRADGSRPDGGAPAVRGPPRRRAGLSLLEVLITIALLTSVTLGTTVVLVPVARQSRINRETTLANARVRRVIETLLAIPFRDIVRTYPDRSVLELEDLPAGTLSVSYVDPSANPLEIHLELEWTSPDMGSMAFSFVTARTD